MSPATAGYPVTFSSLPDPSILSSCSVNFTEPLLPSSSRLMSLYRWLLGRPVDGSRSLPVPKNTIRLRRADVHGGHRGKQRMCGASGIEFRLARNRRHAAHHGHVEPPHVAVEIADIALVTYRVSGRAGRHDVGLQRVLESSRNRSRSRSCPPSRRRRRIRRSRCRTRCHHRCSACRTLSRQPHHRDSRRPVWTWGKSPSPSSARTCRSRSRFARPPDPTTFPRRSSRPPRRSP